MCLRAEKRKRKRKKVAVEKKNPFKTDGMREITHSLSAVCVCVCVCVCVLHNKAHSRALVNVCLVSKKVPPCHRDLKIGEAR